MKKKALAAVLALMLILPLAACGGSAAPQSFNATAADLSPAEAPAAMTESAAGVFDSANGASREPDGGSTAEQISQMTGDKIIYSGYAEIETTAFDDTLAAVDALIARVGGFLESSSVTGSNYYSGRDYRSASYTIRIPAGSFADVTGSLSELGNVTYCNTGAENITTQYTDTASRLEAYQIEYDRLLDMLKKAANVEEMLAIEQRLSDVRYNIESLTTTINGWDSLINYSTLNLSITEVKSYTSAQGATLSYWEEMGQNLKSTLRGVGNFFKGAFMFIVSALPVLLILAAVAVAVVVIVRKAKKRKAAKLMPRPPESKEAANTDTKE